MVLKCRFFIIYFVDMSYGQGQNKAMDFGQ